MIHFDRLDIFFVYWMRYSWIAQIQIRSLLLNEVWVLE